jgi:hypothetical protein
MNAQTPKGRHGGKALDVLRSCYSVDKLRLEGGALVPRRWVWWFVDIDPDFAERHTFGSADYYHPDADLAEGSEVNREGRQWVCGSFGCARTRCSGPTVIAGATFAENIPCPSLASVLPQPLNVDIGIVRAGEQGGWVGTAQLTYLNPWQMNCTFFDLVNTVTAEVKHDNVCDLYFPDGARCGFEFRILALLSGFPASYAVNETLELGWNAVPSIPWSPPALEWSEGATAVTMGLLFSEP